ncbi:MAG: helix-turn-helix domain-containing protein [Leadbetterella sp.]|nr:helix-turn-helix domain-containing protein [Leadbetterella sp.]
MAYVNENIRILRNRMGLTQEKFAELMGINRKAIGAYEENRATPPLDKLNRMATLFGVSLDQLTQHRFSTDSPLFEEPEDSPEPSSQKAGFRAGGIPGQSGASSQKQQMGRASGSKGFRDIPNFRRPRQGA